MTAVKQYIGEKSKILKDFHQNSLNSSQIAEAKLIYRYKPH